MQQILQGTGLAFTLSGNTLTLTAAGNAQSLGSETLTPVTVFGQPTSFERPDAISSVTGGKALLLDTPRSVQIIPATVITAERAQDLGDVLKNLSGVQERASRGEAIDSFVIRGQTADIRRDGVLVTSDINARLQTANIEQVEVIRGPITQTFGAGSVGGVVNVVTKKPKEEAKTSITAVVDEHGRQELIFDSTGPVNTEGSVLFRLVAAIEDSETFIEVNDSGQHDEIKRDLIAPSLTWKIDEANTLTVGLEYTDNRQNSPGQGNLLLLQDDAGNISLFEGSFDRRFGDPNALRATEATRLTVDYEHVFDNGWTLSNTTVYSDSESELRFLSPLGSLPALANPLRPNTPDTANVAIGVLTNTINNQFLTPSGLLALSQISADRKEDIFSSQFVLNGELSTGFIEHDLAIGLDYRRRNVDSLNIPGVVDTATSGLDLINPLFAGGITSSATIIDVADPVFDLQGEPRPNVDNSSTTKEASLFVHDTLSLSEQFDIAAGFRYDYFRVDRDDITLLQSVDNLLVPVNIQTVQSTGDETNFAPNLAFIYKPQQNLTFYTSYSESFERSRIFTNVVTGEVSVLEPIEGEQYELGFKAELFDAALILSSAIFEASRINVQTSTDDVTGEAIIADGVKTEGFEFDAALNLDNGWGLVFNYAYNDSVIEGGEDEGNVPAALPRNTANLLASYRFSKGRLNGLNLGGSAIYVDSRFVSNDNSVFELEDYTVYDLVAAYDLATSSDSRLRLQAGVRNVTDERYAIGSGTLRLTQGLPRTFYASVGYEF